MPHDSESVPIATAAALPGQVGDSTGAFFPGVGRSRRSSSMEDLGSAMPSPGARASTNDDNKSVGASIASSFRSKKSSMSEAADAAYRSLSADKTVSLRLQALFQYCLIAPAVVSLFVWAPRVAFGTRAALDWCQLLADLLFAAFYMFGCVRVRQHEKARVMAKSMSLLDDVVNISEQRWSAGSLSHRTNVVLHVALGTVLPVCGDIIAVHFLTAGDARDLLVAMPGCLRLIRLLGFSTIFTELYCNLTVPHYPIFVLKNLIGLCANIHSAACIFWVLARQEEFNDNTWVGAGAPQLVNETMFVQYTQSLYLAAITASTVGYGDLSPVSQMEVIFTILYVMLNIFIVANIVGGVSAMATMDGQELAAQRRVCDEFEKMLAQHRISEDVAQATRQFLRMDMHDAHADIDQLPMSVRTRIREERFADTLISQPLFKGLTRRFINACIACVHEDTYVAGLDVVREHDVPNKCSIILDGFAAILVNDPENIDNEGGAVAVATLIPGSCFGAEGFMTSTAMTWTVQAKTLLKTISFSEADRDHLEERYPHDFHKLRTNLLNNTQQIETAAARLAEQMIEKADIEARQAAAQAEADRDSASRLFGEIDIDGSGELDLGEIRSLVNRLGLPLSNNQVKDALAQMDWNGDGAVTQTDFMEWYETARSIDRQSDSAVETQMIQGIEAKVSAQQKWGRLKGNLKDAAGMTTNKNRMSLFVKGLSQRTKLHSLRIWLEMPTAEWMTPTVVQELADRARDAKDEIARDRKRASHDLAGLICHLATNGDAIELERMLTLVPISEIPADYDGRAGLHLAAAGGHVDAVKCLVNHSADVNALDRFGRTPLAEAVLNGKDDLIALLRSSGAELLLDEVDQAGKLCAAAEKGDNQLIQRYLDAGADVNASDYDKRTALMLAAAEGGLQTCKMLIDAGADRTFKDRWGHTAGDEAVYHKHTGTLLHLLNQDDYHIFISYRSATDKALAMQLYNSLSTMTLQETGQEVRVYLDNACLQGGQRWDVAFSKGLAKSWIVCPIISDEMVETLTEDNLVEGSGADDVLLELIGALELYTRQHERATVKAILPIISPNRDGSEFSWSLVDQLSDDTHLPTVSAVARQLREHESSAGLADHDVLNGVVAILNDLGQSTGDANEKKVSVKGIMASVLRFQGVRLSVRNDNESLRDTLTGLKMSEIVARAPDHGIDARRLRAAMDDSGDPVKTGIDMIVSEALAAPQFAMDECTERILATVKSLLSGGPVAKGGLGQSPAAAAGEDNDKVVQVAQLPQALRGGGGGGGGSGGSQKKGGRLQRMPSVHPTPRSMQQKQSPKPPPHPSPRSAIGPGSSSSSKGSGGSMKRVQVNLSEVEELVNE